MMISTGVVAQAFFFLFVNVRAFQLGNDLVALRRCLMSLSRLLLLLLFFVIHRKKTRETKDETHSLALPTVTC